MTWTWLRDKHNVKEKKGQCISEKKELGNNRQRDTLALSCWFVRLLMVMLAEAGGGCSERPLRG